MTQHDTGGIAGTAGRINNLMASEGRLLGDGRRVVARYAELLIAAGVPLYRANIAQLLANPLLSAWGEIWTPDYTDSYYIPRTMLDSPSYLGGPFHYVLEHRRPLHKSLRGLDPASAHPAYLELAEAGGTDLFANMPEYGDGSVRSCTCVSHHPDGFSEADVALIDATRHGLASALEPVAMRRSTAGLLCTYLGDGPAAAVVDGSIVRGGQTALDAVIMCSGLRGFTRMSGTWDGAALIAALDGYFEAMVAAVEAHGGDVLKFLGDGVLSIFPTEGERAAGCRAAADAARDALAGIAALNARRAEAGEEALAIGIGLNRGTVTYGNVGSPSRLDFTVVGPAVNLASRVQDLCKSVGEPVLATAAVAEHIPGRFLSCGSHAVRGVPRPVEVFALTS